MNHFLALADRTLGGVIADRWGIRSTLVAGFVGYQLTVDLPRQVIVKPDGSVAGPDPDLPIFVARAGRSTLSDVIACPKTFAGCRPRSHARARAAP